MLTLIKCNVILALFAPYTKSPAINPHNFSGIDMWLLVPRAQLRHRYAGAF